MSGDATLSAPLESLSYLQGRPDSAQDPLPKMRQVEECIAQLVQGQRHFEALKAIESVEMIALDYFRELARGGASAEAVDRAQRRVGVVTVSNRAWVHWVSGERERAAELLLSSVELVREAIEAEQIRVGYLQVGDSGQRASLEASIRGWRCLLARQYYLAGVASQDNADIAIMSSEKSLMLVRQLYQEELSLVGRRKGRAIRSGSAVEHTTSLREMEEYTELGLLLELKDKISYSKYMNIITVNSLLDLINAALGSGVKPLEDHYLPLWLSRPARVSLRVEGAREEGLSYEEGVELRVLQFLNYDLLSRMQGGQQYSSQQEYLKLKSTKNLLYLHLLAAYLYKQYLPGTPELNQRIQQLQAMYVVSSGEGSEVTLHQISMHFGISISKVGQIVDQQDESSLIEVLKPKSKSKKKKSGSSKKDRKRSVDRLVVVSDRAIRNETKSKEKDRKDKGKGIKAARSKPHAAFTQHINQEYLHRNSKKPKPRRDHLTKALTDRNLSVLSNPAHERGESKRHAHTEAVIGEASSKEKRAVRRVAYHARAKR